jgi:hypothetical protein
MHDKSAGLGFNRFTRRAHHAAAFETEIDFGGVGMTMIRTDLARLPAGDGEIAVAIAAEDFLDVASWHRIRPVREG